MVHFYNQLYKPYDLVAKKIVFLMTCLNSDIDFCHFIFKSELFSNLFYELKVEIYEYYN